VQLLIGGEDLETKVILEVLGEDISSGQEKSFFIEYCDDLNSKNQLVWEKLGEYFLGIFQYTSRCGTEGFYDKIGVEGMINPKKRERMIG